MSRHTENSSTELDYPENQNSGLLTFPASSAQSRLWFLDKLHPEQPVYNVPIAVQLDGFLDPKHLEAAINEVVRRHEILRTSFTLVEGQLLQVVNPSLQIQLSHTRLEHLPRESRTAEACRIAHCKARELFDLQHLPLIRVHLIRLSDCSHIMVINVHHIVFDGWSLALFFREMIESYLTYEKGEPSDFPDLSIQYGDFADWQNEILEADSSSLQWWKDKLKGTPPAFELPTDYPRPDIRSGKGKIESLDLSEGLLKKVQSFARTENASVFMTLLAAFQALLFRYSGQEDIVTGIPVAGRTVPRTEQLIGLFINSLILRCDLSGDPTFRKLLREVRTQVLDAIEHEETPFERVVQSLRPERNLSRAPLFQILFIHDKMPLDQVEWPGIQMTPLELDTGTSKFDLSLYIFETKKGLKVRAEFDSDLFESATIHRFLCHYENLLESVIRSPDQPISDPSFLTANEHWELVEKWNQTSAAYPQNDSLHALVSKQAAETPQKIAVASEGEFKTYRQIEEESDHLARRLRQEGVQSGVLAGLCVDRTPAMIIGMLGILKTGGAFVPIDPAYPQERITYMLEKSNIRVVVTQHTISRLFPDGPFHYVYTDEIERFSDRNEQAMDRTHQTVAPEDPAYVIFTSGSTGEPKGVTIPHRAVVNFLTSMKETPGIDPQDILLAVTTLSFDIAFLELLLPLISGSQVVIASREETMDAVKLADKIKASGATIMQATPSTWRMLLAAGWSGSRTLRILSGGEALTRDLADQLLAKGRELWNLYGPTETTIWSSACKVTPGTDPIRIGHPIANTNLHILDNKHRPVPFGVRGELYIGGDGLARGYLNDPASTEIKFIPHPFSTRPGNRIYRTGDLARRSKDGSIELIGRDDHQVKIRGHRIELGEIETALRNIDFIREAVVTADLRNPENQKILAHLVPVSLTDRDHNSAGEIRRQLKRSLPDAMIPSAFIFLDKLPLTPNGKIDRNALPQAQFEQPEIREEVCLPGNNMEKKISAIWSEVLDLQNPDVTTNFFDLGGHSLSLARIQIRIIETFQRELSMVTLLQFPTIRSLAKHLSEDQADLQQREFDQHDSLRQRTRQRAERQRAAMTKTTLNLNQPAP